MQVSSKEAAWAAYSKQKEKKAAAAARGVPKTSKRRKTAIDHTNEKSHLYYIGKLNELRALTNYYKGLWEGGSGAYWQGRYEQLVETMKEHADACKGEDPTKRSYNLNRPNLPSSLKPDGASEWAKSKGAMGPLTDPVPSYAAFCAEQRIAEDALVGGGGEDWDEEDEEEEG